MISSTRAAVLMCLMLVLAACTTPSTPASAEASESEAAAASESEAASASTEPSLEPVSVHVAMTPFFDYQFFSVAQELGWTDDLSVEMEVTWLTQSGPSIEALATGSVDTVNTCVVCNFPFYESVPELTNFLTVNQFKGFVLIGRTGQARTYDEFLEELGDPDEARQATLEQLRGATFPIYLANYEPLLRAMLDQADMTLDDVETVNFADDEKAALAMIGGTGDFYMGGLPSEINLLSNHPEDFVLIGGSEILGPAGLWYSQVASSDSWLADNEEAALRIMAMSYRYNRYVQEQRDTIMPIVAEAMNAHSGVGTTVEELEFIFDNFLEFRTYQEEGDTTYNPDSDLYWANSATYYVEQSQDLPEDADYLRGNPLEDWFDKLLARQDLLDWIDAPLE